MKSLEKKGVQIKELNFASASAVDKYLNLILSLDIELEKFWGRDRVGWEQREGESVDNELRLGKVEGSIMKKNIGGRESWDLTREREREWKYVREKGRER